MKARILVVDDDKDVRDLVRAFLEAAGYEVIEAADVATARQSFTGPPSDAVLLDLKLPDGHGIELLPELRKKWPGSKVIILTGDHTVATAEAVYKTDERVYLLNKPFDSGMLEAVVGLALMQRSSNPTTSR